MSDNEQHKIDGHVKHAGKADLDHETTVETEGHLASGAESALEVDHEKRVDGHVVEHEHYVTGDDAGDANPATEEPTAQEAGAEDGRV